MFPTIMKFVLGFLLISLGSSVLRKKTKEDWNMEDILKRVSFKDRNQPISCYNFLSKIIKQVCPEKEAAQLMSTDDQLYDLKSGYSIPEKKEAVLIKWNEISKQNINNLNNLLLKKKKKHMFISLIINGIQSTDHYMALELKNEELKVYQSYQEKYSLQDSLKKKPISIYSFIESLRDITSGKEECIKKGIETIICVENDGICQSIIPLWNQPNTIAYHDVTHCFNNYSCSIF